MAITCITCGSTMPDISEFCPSCGRAVQRARHQDVAASPTAPSPTAKSEIVPSSQSVSEPAQPPAPPVVMNDRLVAAAAYFTFLPAVAFLFLKPYAGRRFVRFHSLQSVCFWLMVAVLLGLGVIASTFGFLLIWLFTGTLVALGLTLTWLVLSIKALQGEWFRLPALGDFCEQFVSAK
jgi:uncharacterized membrane protein